MLGMVHLLDKDSAELEQQENMGICYKQSRLNLINRWIIYEKINIILQLFSFVKRSSKILRQYVQITYIIFNSNQLTAKGNCFVKFCQ